MRLLTNRGLCVGNDVILDIDVFPLPPVVVLSACHVWPRATGAVGIAELLLRRGASTVLGTLVPINVMRNAILMARLVANMADAMTTRSEYRTLEDVWHHTLATNAVILIISSHVNFQEWANGQFRQPR